ncbi:MAG: S41 family peptidase [Pseudomonadota bacterium]
MPNHRNRSLRHVRGQTVIRTTVSVVRRGATRAGQVAAMILALVVAAAWTSRTAAAPPDDMALTLMQMRTLTDVMGHVQRDYVDDTADAALLEDAIRGMLSGLDRHTVYLDADQYRRLESDSQGRYGGIGIEVDWREGELAVVAVTEEGPAARAGIVRGDIIREVEGIPITKAGPRTALERVRGPADTKVTITVGREGQADRRMTLRREVIRIITVHGELLDGGLAYLKIGNFQTGTAGRVADTLAELEASHGAPLGGLILDLRGNPGGVLSAAVGVSDLFLSRGDIVSTRGRDGADLATYQSDADDALDGAPIVLLLDKVSASASEIVAGALKDHGRATLLGEKSFGKGSVQTVLPLRNGGAIKLTTARYYTPSGVSIHGTGIEPHIAMESKPGPDGIDRALLEATKLLRQSDFAGQPAGADSN